MDFLPGALSFDPAVDPVDPSWAARVLWFDAFVLNVDRSWRNPNSLWWGGRPWLIDHGAVAVLPPRLGPRRREHRPPAAPRRGPPAAAVPPPRSPTSPAPAPPPSPTTSCTPPSPRCPTAGCEGEPGFADADDVRAAYLDWFGARRDGGRGWVADLARVQEEGPPWLRGWRCSSTPSSASSPASSAAEFVNAGVVLWCRALEHLAARTAFDAQRARALAPDLDVEAVTRHLRALEAVCAGDPRGGAPTGEAKGARFRWLVAPRSTVLQTSPVHCGLTADPAAELDRLVAPLVRPGG